MGEGRAAIHRLARGALRGDRFPQLHQRAAIRGHDRGKLDLSRYHIGIRSNSGAGRRLYFPHFLHGGDHHLLILGRNIAAGTFQWRNADGCCVFPDLRDIVLIRDIVLEQAGWLRWGRIITAGLVTAAAVILPALAADDSADTACEIAGGAAERQQNLPSGLLLAMGLVESGRRDPVTQRVAAWPWTVNANGTGTFYASLAEAVAATRAQRANGVASIDVGCFQINLLEHPSAFDSLEAAFDPQGNAAYAARFLASLHDRTGSWESAVAAYHSSTTERGNAYLDKVLARWGSNGTEHGDHIIPVELRSPMQAAGGIRVWTPSSYGSAPTMIRTPVSPSGTSQSIPSVNIIGP